MTLPRPFPVLATVLVALATTVPTRAGETKQISGRELVRLGFFQDFDELNLEDLLSSSDLKTSVASLRESALEQAPGVVSVVTAEEIRALGARRLEDVLRTLPGFDVMIDNLGRSRIVVRGTPPGAPGSLSDTVLILVDGQRLTEALSGGASVTNLDIPVENVKRIEVLRGPGAALYGASAFAAVIDIRSFGIDDFTGIGISGGAGSFGTSQFGLRLGNSVKGLGIAGFVRVIDTQGAQLSVPADAQTLADRASPGTASISRAPGPTTDHHRSLETSYRLTFRDLALNLRVKNENSDGYVGFTDILGEQNDLNNRQLSTDLTYQKPVNSGNFRTSVSFTQSEIRELLETFPPGFQVPTTNGVSLFPSGVFLQRFLNTRRYGAASVLEKHLGKHDVVAGLNLEREATFGLEAKSNLDFRTVTARTTLEPLVGAVPEAGRSLLAAFVQDSLPLSPKATLTAGARVDHYSDFGTALSPHAALVLALPRDLTLKLLYGRAFRPPTLSELHFNLPGFQSNPDLKATTVDTAELALSVKKREVRLSAGYFSNWIRDAVGPGGPTTPLLSRQFVNLPGYDVRGIELEVRRNFGVSNSLFMSWTHQRPEDRATGGRPADIPSELVSAGATLSVQERLSLAPTLFFRSARPRARGDSRAPLEAATLVNLGFRLHNLYKTLEIQGTAANLFDKRYADPAPAGGVPGDYPRAGRSLLVTASYRF